MRLRNLCSLLVLKEVLVMEQRLIMSTSRRNRQEVFIHSYVERFRGSDWPIP